MGTLIANARKNARNIQYLSVNRDRKFIELQKIECIVTALSRHHIERQNSNQHQQTADHRVQNEFDGSIKFASRVAPDTYQEIHRYQHDFPKHIKEKKIQGYENADHSCLKYKKADKKFFYSIGDVLP